MSESTLLTSRNRKGRFNKQIRIQGKIETRLRLSFLGDDPRMGNFHGLLKSIVTSGSSTDLKDSSMCSIVGKLEIMHLELKLNCGGNEKMTVGATLT